MYIDKKDPQFEKLIKMTPEEFDKYMCETYPIMFRERNLPMSETCMCWGFNIGKGWYYILDQACRKLQIIADTTDIYAIFGQIKEKYGTARFYKDIDTSRASTHGDNYAIPEDEQKIWRDIIHDIVSEAQNATLHTCSECGEYHSHDKIQIGHWIHDVCDKCMVKEKPELKESVETWFKRADLLENFGNYIHWLNDKEANAIETILTKIKTRLRKKFSQTIPNEKS